MIGQRAGGLPSTGLWAVRGALACLWLYEGLWLKVISHNPHEQHIVASAIGWLGIPSSTGMIAIGVGETILAAAVLSGQFTRVVAWVQLAVLFSMHTVATLSGSLDDPLDLWIHSLPTYACIAVLILLHTETRVRRRRRRLTGDERSTRTA